ncbi:hypothetical protein D3C80_1861950 [compost metagenome]
MQPLALAVGDVLDGGRFDAHTPMEARQQAGFRKDVDVAPHGLQRDVEMFGKLFDRSGALGSHHFDQGALARIQCHVRIIKQQKRKIMTHCKIVFCSLLQ